MRTVQRWEQDEGLPVHRHQHDKLGSIYAFKSEIDAWWATRGAVLQEESDRAAEKPGTTPAPLLPPVQAAGSPERWWSTGFAAAGAGLAVIVAVAGLALSRGLTATHTAPRHEPYRLLIAEFQDMTDQSTLVRRVRDALEEQLGASQFAQVVPADQIADYLRLMKKPATTPVDERVGREISLRDGAVDAVVTGALKKEGSSYVATVRFVSPATAAVLGTFDAEASGQDSLIIAMRAKIVQIEKSLDGQLPHDHRLVPVPKVTTVSLHALQLYAQAVELMDQVPTGTAPAFALLTEAIKLDPDFASAQILAAWALFNAGRSSDAFLPYAERAFATIDGTTDEERYYILGSYYQLKRDAEKAISAYEALLRLDPNNYWALGNLGRLYRAMGYHDAEVEVRNRQLEIRPGQFWGAYRLAEALLLKGDVNEAHKPAARAESLARAPQVDSRLLQERRAWFAILPVCEAWLKDDVVQSRRMANELEETLSQRDITGRDALVAALGYSYLTLGQRRAAERMFARLPLTEGRLYHMAVVAAQFGEPERVRGYLAGLSDPANPTNATLGVPMLGTGTLLRVEDLAAGWTKQRSGEDADAQLVKGQLALMKGQTKEARLLLASSIDLREDRSGTAALSGSEWLAKAWQIDGDWQQAIRVTEGASQNRFRSCLFPTDSAHVWLRMRVDLAELYRRVGRDAEATAIDKQMRNLLRTADSDHPLLARLAALENATAAAIERH